MAEYVVNTTPEREEVVVINDHRFTVLGLTRGVQIRAAEIRKTVRGIQTEAATLEADEAAGVETNGHLPELLDQVARALIGMCSLRLKPESGDESAEKLLAGLWESDTLTIDRHLQPLMHHLYPTSPGEGVAEPDPPA